MKIFLIDEDQLERLKQIASRLHGGSDKERDEGHKLWLLIEQIKGQSAPLA